MEIINIKDNPQYKENAIKYIQNKWANKDSMKVYEDCIEHTVTTNSQLPIWYIMQEAGVFIGCAGLISNDFISRMDLWPWICALYIEKSHRGKALGAAFLNRAKADARIAGYKKVYLCTDLTGYYENMVLHVSGRAITLGEAVQRSMNPLLKCLILDL